MSDLSRPDEPEFQPALLDDAGDSPAVPAARAAGLLFYVGAAGLLLAMATDTVAVIGRHIGQPLLGSVEIVEAAILLAASAAMLHATLNGSHAVVHLVVDRLSPRLADAAKRLADLLSGLLFASVTAGNAWLTSDMWSAFEESDLLHLPYRPLHLIATLACAAMAVSFFWRAVAPGGRA